MSRIEGLLLVKETDFEYPFEHGEVINFTLDGVSIHTVTSEIQTSFVPKLPERKETVMVFLLV
jgi:hypothetical protein